MCVRSLKVAQATGRNKKLQSNKDSHGLSS